MNWKNVEKRWAWPNSGYYTCICPEILRKSKKTVMFVTFQNTLILMPEEDTIPTFRLDFHLNQEAEGSLNKVFKLFSKRLDLNLKHFVKCCKNTKVKNPGTGLGRP
jgi:hypothetical protein